MLLNQIQLSSHEIKNSVHDHRNKDNPKLVIKGADRKGIICILTTVDVQATPISAYTFITRVSATLFHLHSNMMLEIPASEE